MEIKVLGPGCANCTKLQNEVINVLAELDIAADVEKISDMNQIISHGVLMTPGLVINGQVKVSGRVPSRQELKDIISSCK